MEAYKNTSFLSQYSENTGNSVPTPTQYFPLYFSPQTYWPNSTQQSNQISEKSYGGEVAFSFPSLNSTNFDQNSMISNGRNETYDKYEQVANLEKCKLHTKVSSSGNDTNERYDDYEKPPKGNEIQGEDLRLNSPLNLRKNNELTHSNKLSQYLNQGGIDSKNEKTKHSNERSISNSKLSMVFSVQPCENASAFYHLGSQVWKDNQPALIPPNVWGNYQFSETGFTSNYHHSVRI